MQQRFCFPYWGPVYWDSADFLQACTSGAIWDLQQATLMIRTLTSVDFWLAALWQWADLGRCCGSFGPAQHQRHHNPANSDCQCLVNALTGHMATPSTCRSTNRASFEALHGTVIFDRCPEPWCLGQLLRTLWEELLPWGLSLCLKEWLKT